MTAFIPLNAKASTQPTGGSSGAWEVTITLVDNSGAYLNTDLAVGNLLFTFSNADFHMVAWRVIEVNGGQPVSPFGPVPLKVEWYDPRSVPEPEPAGGPEFDPTGFICEPTENEGIIIINSWVLNVQEQRKAAEIENLNKMFILDITGPIPALAWTDLTDTPGSITANQYVVGNGAGDGLEFTTLPTIPLNWVDLLDTPGSIQALQAVRGNAEGTALEFYDPTPAPILFNNDEFTLTAIDLANGFVLLSGSPSSDQNVFAWNETTNAYLSPGNGFTLLGNNFQWSASRWGPASPTPFAVDDVLSIRWI